MRYPSVKTLLQITGGDRKVALAVRKVLDERTPMLDQWGRPIPRHTSRMDEAKLEASNRLIDGMHGVECRTFECSKNDFHDPHGFYYLNTGDTYAATLVLYRGSRGGSWRVTSWGDMVEAHERWCSKCQRIMKGWYT